MRVAKKLEGAARQVIEGSALRASDVRLKDYRDYGSGTCVQALFENAVVCRELLHQARQTGFSDWSIAERVIEILAEEAGLVKVDWIVKTANRRFP